MWKDEGGRGRKREGEREREREISTRVYLYMFLCVARSADCRVFVSYLQRCGYLSLTIGNGDGSLPCVNPEERWCLLGTRRESMHARARERQGGEEAGRQASSLSLSLYRPTLAHTHQKRGGGESLYSNLYTTRACAPTDKHLLYVRE